MDKSGLRQAVAMSRFDGFWHVIDVSIGDSNSNDVLEVLLRFPMDSSWSMTSAGVF